MASRLKEDEKNEKIIRGLSKLAANRRCINCNSQGTQYVCTNFATFICINCSGIHREFTHRVKSISMAKFTPQEITALQEGGNERAKGIYFKNWDFERQSLPDSSDIDKLRDFIKHVYVDRRFAGERNVDRPPVVKVEREDSSQERSHGPPYDSMSSPGKDRTVGLNGTGTSSSDTYQKDTLGPTQPVREALTVVPPARILEPPKLDKPSTPRTPAPIPPVQNIAPASSVKDMGTQKAPEVSSISLIDFDSDPEPVPRQQTAQMANQNREVGWASFDTQRPPFVAAPSSASSLESPVVHQPNPGSVQGTNYSKMPIQNNAAHQSNIAVFPAVQHSNPQLNKQAAVDPTNQPWRLPATTNINTTSIVPDHSSSARGSQHFMNGPSALPMGVTPVQAPAPPAVVSGGRKALPEDLFSMLYAPQPAPMPGWHGTPHVPMGYAVQYPTPSPAPVFAQPAQFTNPFAVVSAPKLAHASTFPSLSSMQGALPNLNSSSPHSNALSRANSMSSFGAQWAPQPYQPSYPQASHPSQYSAQPHVINTVQQLPYNTFYTGNQVLGGYSTVGGGYGLSGMNPQQVPARNPRPGNAGSFPSVGGNPFA